MKKLKQQFSDNPLTTPRHETQSSNTIPVDLLIEIFSLVPAKSIARFRCLSKFWSSILRRPDLTELFLTKSLTRPRLFFTFKANRKLFFYSSHQPHNPDDNSTLVATPYKSINPKYVPSDICTQQVFGLVLLQGRKRKLPVICNPATGQCLTLPKMILKEKENISRMYFCYDPIGKQFKVLCMTTSSPFEMNTRVLTLESGKRLWRPVEYESYFSAARRIWGQICINGVLYFGAAFGRSSIIVCFDVRSEKFVFIYADKDMERGNCYTLGCLTLFNYKGKLGLRQLDSELLWGRKELVLWVLEDAGNHKWSKHIYALSPLGKEIVQENSRFVGMTCTGEIVFFANLSNPNFYVFFYNLETNTFTRVNIEGFEKFKHRDIIDTFVDYVENLKFM